MLRPALLVLVLAAGCQRVPAAPDMAFPVGEFALTERSGRPVTHADLGGKVWVASFVFTRCAGPCPHVTAAMARLQAELADLTDARLLTVTVDPARDDPATLTRYAANYRADPERWLFLTGPEDEVHRLVRERFLVGVGRAETPTPGAEIDHGTKLAVIDRRGVVRAYFDGVPPEGDDAQREHARRVRAKVVELLGERPV